jgi:hypothetical protein
MRTDRATEAEQAEAWRRLMKSPSSDISNGTRTSFAAATSSSPRLRKQRNLLRFAAKELGSRSASPGI